MARALDALARAPLPANLEIKGLQGRPPWRRLRVGDCRMVYRPLDRKERAALGRLRGGRVEEGTVFVERIVNRRDLERIIASLP